MPRHILITMAAGSPRIRMPFFTLTGFSEMGKGRPAQVPHRVIGPPSIVAEIPALPWPTAAG